MRNGRADNRCRNFILTAFLVLNVIRTVTSFYFKGDEFFQQGFFIPLKKMVVSGGEDIGCRRWSNQQDFEHKMGRQPFITDNMDSQVCLNYCRIKGYHFAAVSEGRKCSCGDETGSLRQTSPLFTCNVPCAGDMKYRCGGGKGHFQLFKIITPAGKVSLTSIDLSTGVKVIFSKRLPPGQFTSVVSSSFIWCSMAVKSFYRLIQCSFGGRKQRDLHIWEEFLSC